MLGVAAATALPSEVFPFRKIFLPTDPKPIDLTGISAYTGVDSHGFFGLFRSPYPGRLNIADIQAVELEAFAKEIPDLLHSGSALYSVFKHRAAEAVLTNGIAFIDRNGVYTLDENEKMVKVSGTPMRIPLTLRDDQLQSLNAAYEKSKKPDLLHAPATPENVMEFIDGLENDLS